MTNFIAGKYYIADYAGNISQPYDSKEEALVDSVSSDMILIALTPAFLETKVKKKQTVSKITIDFDKNVIIITGDNGAKATLNKVKYFVGEYTIPDNFNLFWEEFIEDAFKACKDTEIIGTPPVEGECLDEMLYLQQGDEQN